MPFRFPPREEDIDPADYDLTGSKMARRLTELTDLNLVAEEDLNPRHADYDTA